MGLDISSAKILGGSSLSFVNTSNTTYFERGLTSYGGQNYAFYNNTSVPAFIAGSASDPSWALPVSSGSWGKINNYCTTTVYNRGSNYNTSTTRFTAPVAGPYFFSFSSYIYTDGYVHPVFYVNGAFPAGNAYRIRGHGMVANYQQDVQIEEVRTLNAGDYVEVYWYASGSCYHYPYYSLFQGAYVG